MKGLIRGVAQPGSVLDWGSSGRWFKSSRPDEWVGGAKKRPPFFFMTSTVLLTNDDGVDSSYLRCVYEHLVQAGHHVVVVAPESPQSAASHAITLHKPIRCTQVQNNWYAVSGTPADCVYIALHHVLDAKPAVTVSGINDGFNLGSDIYYSGTVAGALESWLREVPAIATSLAPGGDITYAAEFTACMTSFVLQAAAPSFLNVNFPANRSAYFAMTVLGKRHYDDGIVKRTDPRGKDYFWIGGGPGTISNQPGTDIGAISNQLISVTPLDPSWDRTSNTVDALHGHSRLGDFQLHAGDRAKE